MWRIVSAVALTLAFSCRQIVDFDEPSARSETSVADVPFVPEPAFAESCEACAREQCSAEREACADDAVCRELLRCHATCSNPVCRARCGSFDYRDDQMEVGTELSYNGEESPLFTTFVACVGGLKCSAECNAGRNWSCNEDPAYRWPTTVNAEDTRSMILYIEVTSIAVLHGLPAQVSVFSGGTGPGALWDRQRTDEWGQAELSLTLSPQSFRGFIEVESSERGEVRNLLQMPPVFRATRWTALVLPATAPETQSSPGRASVFVSIRDCLGFRAPGVSFEIRNAEGQPFYLLYDIGVTSEATETDSGGVGGWLELPTDRKNYTLVAKRNEVVIASQSIVVRPDWTTVVRLAPLEAE